MKKTALIVLATLGLTACGAPSVEDFKKDQDKLQAQIEKCQEMKPSEVRESEACQNAATAVQQLMVEGLGSLLGGARR